MRLALNTLIFLSCLVPGGSAWALDDHAVLQGRFQWITRDDDIDQSVRAHWIPKVEIDRQSNGLFRLVLTMPPTLAGGVELKTTYMQRRVSTEGVLYFQNPARSDDYIKCDGDEADSWDGLSCREITLHSLDQIDLSARQQYLQTRYGGTDLNVGMSQAVNSISGAQPAGTVRFFSEEVGDYPFWVGTWSVTYTTPTGQSVNAIMIWDGYSGSYRAGNARGSLRDTYVDGDAANGNWQMGSAGGYFEFHKAGNGAFTGEWHSQDGQQSGSWNGTRLQ